MTPLEKENYVELGGGDGICWFIGFGESGVISGDSEEGWEKFVVLSD